LIWRPFNIITPLEKAGKEQGFSHVFADFIQAIVIDKVDCLNIIGNGEQIRCFTWIGEVASAIANLSFGKEQGAFNLCRKEPTTMNILAKMIHEKAQFLDLIDRYHALQCEHLPAPEDDVRIRIADTTRTEEVFGWTAKVSTEQSITKCLQYISKNLPRC
jgi:nucleoside-diphosphate-sugar epimerase